MKTTAALNYIEKCCKEIGLPSRKLGVNKLLMIGYLVGFADAVCRFHKR